MSWPADVPLSGAGSWAAPCRPEATVGLRIVQQADGDLYLTDSPFLAVGRPIPLISGPNGLALDDTASSGLSLRKKSSGIAAYDD